MPLGFLHDSVALLREHRACMYYEAGLQQKMG